MTSVGVLQKGISIGKFAANRASPVKVPLDPLQSKNWVKKVAGEHCASVNLVDYEAIRRWWKSDQSLSCSILCWQAWSPPGKPQDWGKVWRWLRNHLSLLHLCFNTGGDLALYFHWILLQVLITRGKYITQCWAHSSLQSPSLHVITNFCSLQVIRELIGMMGGNCLILKDKR